MMNSSEKEFQELRELLEKVLDGSISSEEMDILDDYIVHNPELRQYYCEYLHMTIGLTRLSGYAPLTGVQEYDKRYFESLWNALILEEKESPAVAKEEPIEKVEVYHSRKDSQKVSSRKATKGLLFTAVISLAALLFIITSACFFQMLIPMEIATITTSLHAGFADNQCVASNTRLLNRKAPFLLQTGLIEIIFDGGAKVTLEAPAAFRLKSSNQMVLYAGKLFALVPIYARGFTVETPNSRIVDRGTEFGVKSDVDGSSELHVFKGKVQMFTGSIGDSKTDQIVAENKAVRYNTNSNQIETIPVERKIFARKINSKLEVIWRGQNYIDLADIVGGGNGFGTGEIDMGIDPVSGKPSTVLLETREATNEYRPVPSNSYIDGVFVPNGRTRQIVSSQGHIFQECPVSGGSCFNNILNVRRILNSETAQNATTSGSQTAHCILLHANIGITFDIQAIRTLLPDIKIVRFKTKFGIEKGAPPRPDAINADFWVLVDGKIREKKIQVKEESLFSVDIELSEKDHFLTLVTTDGQDPEGRIVDNLVLSTIDSDWGMFADPVLFIE